MGNADRKNVSTCAAQIQCHRSMGAEVPRLGSWVLRENIEVGYEEPCKRTKLMGKVKLKQGTLSGEEGWSPSRE